MVWSLDGHSPKRAHVRQCAWRPSASWQSQRGRAYCPDEFQAGQRASVRESLSEALCLRKCGIAFRSCRSCSAPSASREAGDHIRSLGDRAWLWFSPCAREKGHTSVLGFSRKSVLQDALLFCISVLFSCYVLLGLGGFGPL